MNIKKPINIFPELSIYIVITLLLLTASRNAGAESGIWQEIWNYWLWIGFLILTAVITQRLYKKEERRFISVFSFGFISGALVWLLFIMSEARSVNSSNIFILPAYIILAGGIAGFIAVFWSSLAVAFIKNKKECL